MPSNDCVVHYAKLPLLPHSLLIFAYFQQILTEISRPSSARMRAAYVEARSDIVTKELVTVVNEQETYQAFLLSTRISTRRRPSSARPRCHVVQGRFQRPPCTCTCAALDVALFGRNRLPWRKSPTSSGHFVLTHPHIHTSDNVGRHKGCSQCRDVAKCGQSIKSEGDQAVSVQPFFLTIV